MNTNTSPNSKLNLSLKDIENQLNWIMYKFKILGRGRPSAGWAKVDRKEGTVLKSEFFTICFAPSALSSGGIIFAYCLFADTFYL